MHKILILLLARSLPILALVFGAVLVIYKIYVKIRYDMTVNCWFCNVNTRVPYMQRNSWYCPHCDQYNGFTADGDYNRDLTQQRDCSGSNNGNGNTTIGWAQAAVASTPVTNGFCELCNEAQRLKVEKLAQFEPKYESRFDKELKVYRAQLEEQYRLCGTCERHLRSVLREKKKMVLGSKFLDIIIKGAELLKQPHYNRLQKAQQQVKMRRMVYLMRICTALNIIALLCAMPHWTSAQFDAVLGAAIGQYLFVGYTHAVTFVRVLGAYCTYITELQWFAKVLLFLRTMAMMMLFSLGLPQARVATWSWAAFYTALYPFVMLGLSFAHNLFDRLKCSRFTLLLLYWSAFAAGIFGVEPFGLLLVSSLVTLALSLTKRAESMSQQLDDSASSFHRLCADDYLSDDETISMLSQQLSYNNSNSTLHSTYQQSSPPGTYTASGNRSKLRQRNGHAKSPKSAHNYLNGSPARPASFVTGGYTQSNCDRSLLSSPPRTSLFASNLDLHNGGGSGSGAATVPTELNNSFHSAYSTAPYVGGNVMQQQQQQQQQQPQPQQSHTTPHAFNMFGQPLQQNQSANLVAPPLLSPFSHTVFPSHQQHSLLSGHHPPLPPPPPPPLSLLKLPTHFSTHNLHEIRHGDTSAWVAASNGGLGFTTQDMLTQKDNLSRTSSLSSGFESQFGNGHSESPFGFAEAAAAVTPAPPESIAYAGDGLLNGRGTNCAGNGKLGFGSYNGSKMNGFGRDTFNLTKMHEQLPNFKRGDLLRKWQENRLREGSAAATAANALN